MAEHKSAHSKAIEDSYAKIADKASKLSAKEAVWRDRQLFLEQRGYMLRPRFRPGWVPSWKGNTRLVYTADDGIILLVSTLPFAKITTTYTDSFEKPSLTLLGYPTGS